MYRPLSRTIAPALLLCFVLLSSCSDDGATGPSIAEPPEVLGQDVSVVGHGSVWLGGWVEGHGRPTVCWFEFGHEFAHDLRTPELDAGAAAGPVRVEYQLTGLIPDTEHWWRLVAVAGGDTVSAADTTFTTLAPPNMSPETRLTSPPLLGDTVVHFYWTGSDADGAVVGFRWRLSDDGLDASIDEPDTLGLPWHFTTATDSVFAVSADLPGTPPDPIDGGPWLFAQSHTFWIKAVDDLGAEDPTPARISLTAVTEAPGIAVVVLPESGPMPDGCLDLPLPVQFTWAATDPDGPPDAVLEVRTLLVDLTDLGIAACLSQAEYEALDPLAAVDDALWSPWQEYDPGSQTQPALVLGPQHVGGRYLFAAMARDGAGAWTRELAWGGNVWQVEVLPD